MLHFVKQDVGYGYEPVRPKDSRWNEESWTNASCYTNYNKKLGENIISSHAFPSNFLILFTVNK